jgi:hypothetical protein
MVLVLANALTLFGVFALNWNVVAVISLFWFENLAIGFWNIFKLALANKDLAGIKDQNGNQVSPKVAQLLKLIVVPFFIVHFGAFCMGHAVFLQVFLFGGTGLSNGFLSSGFDLIYEIVSSDLIWGAIILFGSHGFSFVSNYVGKKEYLQSNVMAQMMRPYSRIFVLHFTIMLMAVLVIYFEKNWMVVPLVLVKTIIDMRMHARQHKNPDKIALF